MSLKQLSKDIIVKNIIDKEIPYSNLDNLDYYSKEYVLDSLSEYDFKIWKYKIYNSLVEIESKLWDDIDIVFIKYYDEYGYRDYYQNIELISYDETIENRIIKEHEHGFWDIYHKKALQLSGDWISETESEKKWQELMRIEYEMD